MPRQPRRRRANAITATTTAENSATSATSSRYLGGDRRDRYDARQLRLRTLWQVENLVQIQATYAEMAEQSRNIQQYVTDERTGNDESGMQLQQIVDTGELLSRNIHRVQQLRREEYEDNLVCYQETLEVAERTREELMLELVLKEEFRGRSKRFLRYNLRQLEVQLVEVQRQITAIERLFLEEDASMEVFQGNIRQVMEHFRERERSNAVRLAFLEPTTMTEHATGYRTSTGRILKSDQTSDCQDPTSNIQVDDCDISSSPLLAKFGEDDDVIPIETGTCVICCLDYYDGDEIYRNAISNAKSRCNHFFHKKCITSWIETSRKAECPCCRQAFVVKS